MVHMLNIRRHPAAIAARQARRAVVSNHVKKTQLKRPRWRAGALQVQTVNSDYAVGAPPTPKLPVAKESPVVRQRSPSPSPVRQPLLPMPGTSTPPWPTVPPGHWFDGDEGREWIVQPWGSRLELKVQRRDGVVTDQHWVVRFPRKHCYTQWNIPTWSIWYNCGTHGFEHALRLALRHKPMRINSKQTMDTENVKTLSRRYLPEAEWCLVGL